MKWPEYKLSTLVEKFISGGTPNTKIENYWDGDIPWITGADFSDGEIILGRRHINQDAVRNSATNIVPKGSIVMVTRTGVNFSPTIIAFTEKMDEISRFSEKTNPEG
jgi:restriction endonuclease S subunit